MPAAISPRSRPPTLLIVGCGDIGLRVLKLLGGRLSVLALSRSVERRATLRAAGARPLLGDLDDAASLGRLGGLADLVLHLAPPAPAGDTDERTRRLLRALARGGRVRRIVYASTSGVYGDCGGALVTETQALRPATARARRRVDAETQLRCFGRATGVGVSVLRIPGIYALDRSGGDPRDRLHRGTPVLAAADDVFTNHIHADDLARACLLALFRGLPQRVVHASDDSGLRMGDYFDLAADLHGLQRPPRLSRSEAVLELSALQLSFMSESRRLSNDRLRRELRLRLQHPTVHSGLVPMPAAVGKTRSAP